MLSPGKYWIGDPCYVLQTKGNPEAWLALLESGAHEIVLG